MGNNYYNSYKNNRNNIVPGRDDDLIWQKNQAFKRQVEREKQERQKK